MKEIQLYNNGEKVLPYTISAEDEMREYDIRNYGLFIESEIVGKSYNAVGELANDAAYTTTNLIYIDKENGIIPMTAGYSYVSFFDENKDFIERKQAYRYVGIAPSEFPINAKYVAFSYPHNSLYTDKFSTIGEAWGGQAFPGAFYSTIKKKKGTRPKVYIYTTDTEGEILSKLTDAALTRDCDVYWETGEYVFESIFSSMWDTYHYGSAEGSREMIVGGNCRYYFNGSVIKASKPSGVSYTNGAKVFGNMCLGNSSFQMFDGAIIASNGIAYCVHSEGLGVDGFYSHEFFNMTFKQIGGTRPLGCGTPRYGKILIDSCLCETDGTLPDLDCHGIHNTYDRDAKFEVCVKNSRFSIGVNVNVLSSNQTGKLVYCNNSSSKAPMAQGGWELVAWNNEIRNS